MASSNRHWPSMFKSKPTCNTRLHHHQWHSNDSNNLISSANSSCHRSSYTSGCEERSPEPKPRWNPKPEQIRILETIFNSGMVNPPREEIRKIRAQLQEYGQVGDANVFYWFQNRKSRSKHKSRLQKPQNHPSLATTKVMTTATTSSSSSSDKSYSKSIDFLLNSPTASVNNQHFGGGAVAVGGFNNNHQHNIEFYQEPFYFPQIQQPQPSPPPTTTTTTASFTEGFCFSESGMLLTDLMMMNQESCVIQKMNNNITSNSTIKGVEGKNMKVSDYNFTPPTTHASVVATNPTTTTTVPSITSDIQGAGVVEPMPGKSTVFINDVEFEVAVGPFNVREAFGDDAVLIHSYGQPVVTNEWGVTLQSLQHGALYYLVRSFSYGQSSTINLI